MKRLHGNIMLGNNRAIMGCEDLSAVTVEAQVLETGASFGVQITVTDDNGNGLPVGVDYFDGNYYYRDDGDVGLNEFNKGRVYLRTKSSFNVKLGLSGDPEKVRIMVTIHDGCKVLDLSHNFSTGAVLTELNLPDSLQEIYFGHSIWVTEPNPPEYPNLTRLALNSEKVKGTSESALRILSGQGNLPNLAELGYYKVFLDEETGENYKEFVEELPVTTQLVEENQSTGILHIHDNAITGSKIKNIKM